MSAVLDIPRPRCPSGTPRHRRQRAGHPAPWRRWAALVGVEVTDLLALVIAVPIGRGAVALTIALAVVPASAVVQGTSS